MNFVLVSSAINSSELKILHYRFCLARSALKDKDEQRPLADSRDLQKARVRLALAYHSLVVERFCNQSSTTMQKNSHFPSPLDDNDRPTITLPPPTSVRGHQRSRTSVDLPPLSSRKSISPNRSSTFLPFLRPASQRSTSPDRVSAIEAAEYDITAPPASIPARQKGAVEKLSSWFDGASDPVNISIVPSPRKEQPDPYQSSGMEKIFSGSSDSIESFTRRPPRRPSLLAEHNSTSRFSFFKKTPAPQQKPTQHDDELAQFDIREALFPHGTEVDEFSPAALKNLQLNAEGLLRRFQHAYTEQLSTNRKLSSQKNIQSDELEAANTKNEHLKLQLVDMAEKSAEQERLITALKADLAFTRASKDTHIQSIRMVSNSSSEQPRYRKNRSSDISVTSADSENVSELSSAVSVFSDTMEETESPCTSVAPSPSMKHASLYMSAVQRAPVFQPQSAPLQVVDCQKCHNTKPSEAWDIIGIMKTEGVVLKQRIAELEAASEDALDFLSGLKLS